jgi:hypothetical protein
MTATPTTQDKATIPPEELLKDQLEQLSQPRRRYPIPRPLIWLHIPKAGGSTLQEVIVRQYMCGFGFRFTGDRAQVAAFKALPGRTRTKFDLVHGHVHFGIHQWVPEAATYITMLREPVDRVVSHYYFILRDKAHYIHRYIREYNLTLDNFRDLDPRSDLWTLINRTNEVDNDMVRWLTPKEHFEVKLGQVTRAMLEEAKWNLANAFTCFGLMERFDESLECFRRALGWEDVSYTERKNVNPERPPLDEMRPDALEAIRHANRYDIELYEFAQTLFEEQMLRLGVRPRRAAGARSGSQPAPA